MDASIDRGAPLALLGPGRFTRISIQTSAGEIEAKLSEAGNWELRLRRDQEHTWRLACRGDIDGGAFTAEPAKQEALVRGPLVGSAGDYCWSAGGEKVFGASEDGLDCSGAVRWLLVLSGFKDTGPIVSGGFAAAYPSGPGSQVTIWSSAAHVFVTIAGRDWGTSETNFAHGPGYAEHTHAGFVASHPPGL